MKSTFAASVALFARLTIAGSTSCGAPTAMTLNGTYEGYHNAFYNEDFFLGIPYAQPPVNNLRYAAPEALNASWTGMKNATQYGHECVGYGVSVFSPASQPVALSGTLLIRMDSWIRSAMGTM